jgi:hypothetical protein
VFASPARSCARLTEARVLKESRVFLMVLKMETRDAEILNSSSVAQCSRRRSHDCSCIHYHFSLWTRFMSTEQYEARNWFPWKCSKTKFLITRFNLEMVSSFHNVDTEAMFTFPTSCQHIINTDSI